MGPQYCFHLLMCECCHHSQSYNVEILQGPPISESKNNAKLAFTLACFICLTNAFWGKKKSYMISVRVWLTKAIWSLFFTQFNSSTQKNSGKEDTSLCVLGYRFPMNGSVFCSHTLKNNHWRFKVIIYNYYNFECVPAKKKNGNSTAQRKK